MGHELLVNWGAWRKAVFEFQWRCKTCAKWTLTDWKFNILLKRLQCCCFFSNNSTTCSSNSPVCCKFICHYCLLFIFWSHLKRKTLMSCCCFFHLFVFTSIVSPRLLSSAFSVQCFYITSSAGSIICYYQVDCRFVFIRHSFNLEKKNTSKTLCG